MKKKHILYLACCTTFFLHKPNIFGTKPNSNIQCDREERQNKQNRKRRLDTLIAIAEKRLHTDLAESPSREHDASEPLDYTQINFLSAPDNIKKQIFLKNKTCKIGSIKFTYNSYIHRGNIEELAIEKEFRKNGYGSLLLQKAIAQLKKYGCNIVELCACPENLECLQKLIQFYARHGFVITKDDDYEFCEGDDGAIMELILNSEKSR